MREMKQLIGRTSMLYDDDGMAAQDFLTRKVLGSLSEVSRDSTKPTKMIA